MAGILTLCFPTYWLSAPREYYKYQEATVVSKNLDFSL